MDLTVPREVVSEGNHDLRLRIVEGDRQRVVRVFVLVVLDPLLPLWIVFDGFDNLAFEYNLIKHNNSF